MTGIDLTPEREKTREKMMPPLFYGRHWSEGIQRIEINDAGKSLRSATEDTPSCGRKSQGIENDR